MSTKKPRGRLRKVAVPGLDKRQARRWRRHGGWPYVVRADCWAIFKGGRR